MVADRKPWMNQLDSYCILINNTHGYKNIIDWLKKSRGNVETRQKTCLKSDQYLHSGNSPRSVIGQSRTWAKLSTRKMILLTTRHQEACRTGCITPGRAIAMPAPVTCSIFMPFGEGCKTAKLCFLNQPERCSWTEPPPTRDSPRTPPEHNDPRDVSQLLLSPGNVSLLALGCSELALPRPSRLFVVGIAVQPGARRTPASQRAVWLAKAHSQITKCN